MSARWYFDRLPSTQSHAVELARSGAPAGTRVVAGVQGDGRGRLDHHWVSPPGSLYLSLIAPSEVAGGPHVSLTVGAALHELLRDRWGVPTEIQWPNDLRTLRSHGARKIAGVLVDGIRAGEATRTVIGVGLNVRTAREEFPPELRRRVAFLGDFLAPVPPLGEVEEAVVGSVDHALEELGRPGGAARYLEVCRRALYGRGSVVRVDGRAVGRVREVADDGALLVEGPTGPVEVRSGEVAVEEAS